MLLRHYLRLLYLYPAVYRCTFGGEMANIFKQRLADVRNNGVVAVCGFLLREFSAVITVALRERARVLKRGAWRPDSSVREVVAQSAGHTLDGVPGFYTCATFLPRRSALINGGLLSIAAFAAVSFAITHWGGHPMLRMGSHGRDHFGLLEVRSPSVASTDLTTAIKVKARRVRLNDAWSSLLSLLGVGAPWTQGEAGVKPQDHKHLANNVSSGSNVHINESAAKARESDDSGAYEWDAAGGQFASAYFQVVVVLRALDTDKDRVISASEIANAPSALRTLDMNHDGKLSPEECGFDIGDVAVTKQGPEFTASARLEFMRFHPVLAALDADHNGEISANEIQNASAALQTLDRNRDHKLTVDETLPDPIASAVALFMRLDSNRDGKISADEGSNRQADPYRELLRAADRNTDGVVTEEELTKEIRLRAVLNGMKVPIVAFDRK